MVGEVEVADMHFKVVIDKAACCGYGVCADICPEIYKLDDNGIVFVDDPLVPPRLADVAREAAEACPQGALAIKAI